MRTGDVNGFQAIIRTCAWNGNPFLRFCLIMSSFSANVTFYAVHIENALTD